jgi:hypothetical protein
MKDEIEKQGIDKFFYNGFIALEEQEPFVKNVRVSKEIYEMLSKRSIKNHLWGARVEVSENEKFATLFGTEKYKAVYENSKWNLVDL